MKKKSILALLLALMLFAMTACSSSGGGSSSGASDAVSIPGMSNSATSSGSWNDKGWNAADEEIDSDVPQENGDSEDTRPQNMKIIYSADLTLESREFDAAIQSLDQIVQGLGGWYESKTVDQGGSFRSMDCTIRVPAERFTALLDQAGQAAHMTYRREYQDDITESYYDSEARLTTQRTKLERLQELLAQAEDMADIITLESAISDTELEIEYLTGSLRHYDNLIGYSTVTVYLKEVSRLSTDEEPTASFGQRLMLAFSTGFHRGIDGLEAIVLVLAWNWFGLLILALIVIAVVLLCRRQRKSLQSRKTPPQRPATPPAPPTLPVQKKEDSESQPK